MHKHKNHYVACKTESLLIYNLIKKASTQCEACFSKSFRELHFFEHYNLFNSNVLAPKADQHGSQKAQRLVLKELVVCNFQCC